MLMLTLLALGCFFWDLSVLLMLGIGTKMVEKVLNRLKLYSVCHIYLHSSPESVQFPQSPGPGPDILVTGSCKSLQEKREKITMRQHCRPYSSSNPESQGELHSTTRIPAWFHLFDPWLSKGASLTLWSLHRERVFGVIAVLLINCLMQTAEARCHTGASA